MRVAISGASGLIGTALSEAIQSRGWEAIPMVRSKDQDGIYWSASKMEIDAQALETIDAVVHLAGENLTTKRWTESQKEKILRSRTDGTALIAGALAELSSPPKVFLSASAVGYYGGQGDKVLTEDDPAGTGFLAEVCERWEAAAGKARAASIRVVHPRIGIVLSKEGGALKKMLLPFKLGIGGNLGDGSQYFSWVGLDDVVRALIFLIDHPELSGPFNLTAPEPVSNKEFTRALGKALGRPTFLPVPSFGLKMMMGSELAEEALLQGQRALPRALLDAGFEFQAPTIDEALKRELS